MDLDQANFLAATIAAFAAIFAARWVWIDRPTYLWHYRIKDDDDQDNKQLVTISALGTGIAYNVAVRAVGYLDPKETSIRSQPEMRAGSPPIEFVTFRSRKDDAKDRDTYIEIAWTTSRPRRRHGQRMNTRTRKFEVWRWSWRDVEIQRVPEAPERGFPWLRPWEYRLVRTSGDWVSITPGVLHEISGFESEPEAKAGEIRASSES